MSGGSDRPLTRNDDDGSTGLADGTRVTKDSARIHAIGSVDELNSHLGVPLLEPMAPEAKQLLLQVQTDLLDLGTALALPAAPLGKDKLAPPDSAGTCTSLPQPSFGFVVCAVPCAELRGRAKGQPVGENFTRPT